MHICVFSDQTYSERACILIHTYTLTHMHTCAYMNPQCSDLQRASFYIHIYIHTCTHAYMRTREFSVFRPASMFTYTYTHAHMHTRAFLVFRPTTYEPVYSHIHAHTYTCIYIYIHPHTYFVSVQTYSNKPAYSHTHTHIQRRAYLHFQCPDL